MGWNTSILFLNDGMTDIERNPQEVVDNIRNMMHGVDSRGRELSIGGSLPVGSHVNNMSLISRDHADVVNLVAIGGNRSSTLLRGGYTLHGNHVGHDNQVKLLKAAAEALGYRLSKIPGK